MKIAELQFVERALTMAYDDSSVLVRQPVEAFAEENDPMRQVLATAFPVGELDLMRTFCDFHRDDPEDVVGTMYQEATRESLARRLDGLLYEREAPQSPTSDSATAC
jgi:hypothetical protein